MPDVPGCGGDVYDSFISTITTLQRESPQAAENAFIVPAFVKPSRNGPVTWRQCCVIRFWPPECIPGPRDLAERSQLRCFPLFPRALDWRRAMEPVALRNSSVGVMDAHLHHFQKHGQTHGTASATALQTWVPKAQKLLGGKAGRAGSGGSSSSSGGEGGLHVAPSEAAMRAYADRKSSAESGEISLPILIRIATSFAPFILFLMLPQLGHMGIWAYGHMPDSH